MPPSMALHVRTTSADLRRQGIAARDMSAAGALELARPGGQDATDEPGHDGAASIEWLENDPLRARDVSRRAAPSPFRYFLDATQRSLPCFYIGAVPIVCGFVSAGILERGSTGAARLVPGAHLFDQFFVAPTRSGDVSVDLALQKLCNGSVRVIDPIDEIADDERDDEERRRRNPHDFGELMNMAYRAVSTRRQQIEVALLEDWVRQARDGILVVDGPLRSHAPGAIGVVKSFTTSNLSADATAALFELQMNQRSAVFRVDAARGRSAPLRAWHQRFWGSTGLDPRHALVRIETSDADPAGAVEDLAGWLMEERAPRATNDQRWPTLLYPIHYLEQILKKQLDAATRGWPGQ